MKKSLISPSQKMFNQNTGDEIGVQIVEVCDVAFEVALPLFWIDCDDNVNTVDFYFSTVQNKILPSPPLPIPVQPVSTGTQTL